MNNNPITCDRPRIELFLQQKLSDEEQVAFELHLDDCEDCRVQLETAAAGDDIWSGVRESLTSGPFSMASEGQSAIEVAENDDASSTYDTVLKLLAPTDDERMLGRLGTYEVVGVIGSGGMGVVLKAYDTALNRFVAIKVLAPHLGNSGAARKRFAREAQAAAAVVHDNVIEIHGVADTGGLSYLVMPYVRGPSLQRRLDDNGPLALVETLRIGMQAAAGLAAAHAQGLVHRDVKPANILLADGVERVKLTDFGLARAADDASLTRTGVIAGTPQYMSPEQARGELVDRRSDLFSLGCVLYAMCIGRAPFRAETSYAVLRRITDDEPRPIREINPDIPEWFCRIIEKLMSKRPDDRFGSAREVSELLKECLAHVQQPSSVPLPKEVPRAQRATSATRLGSGNWRRRSAAIVTAIALLGFGGAGAFMWATPEPSDISGDWTGEGWNQVTLQRTGTAKYTGTYTDTFGAEPGKIELKWSRIERRYNGTWSEGKDRFGKISVRPVGEEIRGAWTTNRKSNINPGTPELAELLWVRAMPVADLDSGLTAVRPEIKRVLQFDTGLTGHNIHVACSPDGKLIAVASSNPTMIMMQGGRSRVADNWRPEVKIIDAETGKTVASLQLTSAEEDAVLAATERISHFEPTALAFSPDGKMLAVGTSIGQVKLFDVRANDLLRSLDDEKAKIADKKTPENWRSLRRAMGSVQALAFSPDGKLLATCGTSFEDFAEKFESTSRLGMRTTGPGRLKVWDAQTGALNHDLVGHNDFATSVAFSPDSHLLASAGRWSDKGEMFGNGVLIWNAQTGGQIHRLIRTTANGGVRAIAFSPDSKTLAVGTQRFGDSDQPGESSSTGGVGLVNVSSGIEQWLVTVPGWARPVAFSPDGKNIVALCGGQSIRFLEAATGATEHEIRPVGASPGLMWDDFAIASHSQLAVGAVDKQRKAHIELWDRATRSAADEDSRTSRTSQTPAHSLVVQLHDGNGQPIPGVMVIVYDGNNFRAGQPVSFQQECGTSDRQGRVVFAGLLDRIPADSSFLVQVQPLQGAKWQPRYVLVHDAKQLGEDPLVNVDPIGNESVRVDFTLRDACPLEFDVVDAATNKPIHFAQVLFQDKRVDKWTSCSLQDSDGQHDFTTIVPEMSDSRFMATSEGYYAQEFKLTEPFYPDRVVKQRIELRPAPLIELTVLDGQGKPVVGATLEYVGPQPRGSWAPIKPTDADGRTIIKYPEFGERATYHIRHGNRLVDFTANDLPKPEWQASEAPQAATLTNEKGWALIRIEVRL